MAIRKIVFKDLKSSYRYIAFGGVRIFTDSKNFINSGNKITDTMTTGETTTIKATATSTYSDNFRVLRAFDVSFNQNNLTYAQYWLTDLSNTVVTLELKTPIERLSKISLNTRPQETGDRGLTGSFTIEFYDELNRLISAHPIAVENTAINHVQTIKFTDDNKTLILSTNEFKTFDITDGWQTVSTTFPTVTEFTEQGMDSLTPLLDRKVMQLEPQVMDSKIGILPQGSQAKIFSKKLDLNKYIDIRKIEVE